MTHPALRRSLIALSIVLLPVGAAQAGGGLYLNIKSIPGESTDPGHAGQIDVGALSWGVSIDIGPRSGPVLGKPQVQDISWIQGLDKSVVPLFGAATTGQHLPSASFEVVMPNSKGNAPYLSLTAEPTMVSSISFGDGGSGSVTGVSGSMNPAAVSLRYDPSALGQAGPALTTHYDLAKNTTTGPDGRLPTTLTGNTPAHAGLYLRLGSGATSIAGDSRATGYENWIPITAFSMGTSIAMSFDGRVSSKPSVQNLSWSQQLDATAPAVLFDLLTGTSIGQATIEQVVLGRDGRPVTVMQQALNDVLFSSFALGASGGADGQVSFNGTMDFASYTQTLWPLLADGSRGGPFSIGYDVVSGNAIPGVLASNVAGFGGGSLDPAAQPVPEPQTWAMMLAGIAGLAGAVRRRHAAA